MNAVLLYTGLVKSQVLRRGQALRGLLIRIVVASALMAAFLWWFGGDIATWLVTPKLQRIGWLTGLVAGGIGVYFVGVVGDGRTRRPVPTAAARDFLIMVHFR